MRTAGCLSIVLAYLTLSPAGAAADGLPVPVDGSETASVVSPSGEGPRYTTVSLGDRTRVLQIDPTGGEVMSYLDVDGEYGIPLVALDGTPSGLSADGDTLVLINPRQGFPRRETSFQVVGILNGAVRRVDTFELTLRGDYSFDALSPDGETLYLIEYTSRRDPGDYVVREYDLKSRSLVSEPVLVPDEPPGEMRGFPITRVTSPDGRWEYTLYDGGGDGEPFIHGLDTVESVSVCIDLPQLEDQRRLLRVDLALDPGDSTITVTGKGAEPLAFVDTGSFEVSNPPAADASADNEDERGIAMFVAVIAVGLVLVAGTVTGLRRRRRNSGLPADPFIGESADPDPDREGELERT